MWRSQQGHKVVQPTQDESDDDWDTEADYENTFDDKDHRKAARTVGDAVSGNVVQDTEATFTHPITQTFKYFLFEVS